MSNLTNEQVQAVYEKHKTIAGTARELGVSRKAVRYRLGLSGGSDSEDRNLELFRLQQRNRQLQAELTQAKKDRVTDKDVREHIFKLASLKPQPPKWLLKQEQGISQTAGVPTLMLSDWHWSEVVTPEQVMFLNEYNMEIAANRLYRVVERTIDLLLHHIVNPSYPGIVVALAGDMHSGDIHEELSETNETPLMYSFTNIQEHLIWALSTLADHFGRVFVPCVVGNHGRNTRKPRHKNKVHTNFDWLLYQQLEKWFENDDRIQFLIAEGSDVQFQIYHHRYRLAHGDAFRGGHGFVGPYAPIIRGETKKRSAADSYGAGYDTLLIGHFHQYMALHQVIVNGSGKGYDEFAINNDFPFEPPRQALWLTHPNRGITFNIPVQANDKGDAQSVSWVSWKEENTNTQQPE